MSTIYPSSLSDAEWEGLQLHLPTARTCGRPRTHSLRDSVDAIFYVLRTGCPWRYLPANFPPWQTVFSHFRRWRLKGTWHRVCQRRFDAGSPALSTLVANSASVGRLWMFWSPPCGKLVWMTSSAA